LIESIEDSLSDITDPIMRFGMGFRLWMKRAESDRAWCGFAAQMRLSSTKAREKPVREMKPALHTKQVRIPSFEASLRARQIDVPSYEAGLDLVLGAGTNAMHRMLESPRLKNYGDQVARVMLRGLGVKPKTIEEIIRQPLPEFRSRSNQAD
jgi:hypothetical protein